jgi:CBS-domain-containing membrane protein
VIVAEVMSRRVVSVEPETSLKEAAGIMLQAGVSGLPVVDADGRLVGIITEADFLDQEAEHSWSRPWRLLDGVFGRGEEALARAERVADVMTRDVVTVAPDTPLPGAARTMLEQKVKRLPVIDDTGDLVGIVSRADVMKAFARSDEDIAADVARLFAHQVILVEPGEVEVFVTDGVVRLSGMTENRGDAEALVEVVGHIDGVVRVEPDLDFKVDERRPEERWPGFDQEGGER